MKAAIYARVSTADQHTEQQVSELRRYVEARGWTVFREYVDQISGAKTLTDAEAFRRSCQGVVVWEPDSGPDRRPSEGSGRWFTPGSCWPRSMPLT